MEKDNSFLVPDELGWECNDKLDEELRTFFDAHLRFGIKGDPIRMSVSRSQCMDNMYAIIKKYQKTFPSNKSYQRVVRALTDKGVNPDFHESRSTEVFAYLKEKWPTLYMALKYTIREYNKGQS